MNNYKVKIKEDNTAEVVALLGEDLKILPLGNIEGLNSVEIDNLARQVIANNNITGPIIEKDVYDDIKHDIDFARVEMRKIMKAMSSKDLTTKEKNELTEICKTEICASIALGKFLKQRIELEQCYGKK